MSRQRKRLKNSDVTYDRCRRQRLGFALELNVPLITWDQDQLATAGQLIVASNP